MVLKDAESVLQRVILAALAGDMRAAQLVLDRALPKRICRGVPSLEMPAIKTAEDAVLAMAAIVRAAVSGEISTGEAAELSQVIENFRRMLETSEFDCRLRDLEQRLASTGDEA